jgi:hypothetical protein
VNIGIVARHRRVRRTDDPATSVCQKFRFDTVRNMIDVAQLHWVARDVVDVFRPTGGEVDLIESQEMVTGQVRNKIRIQAKNSKVKRVRVSSEIADSLHVIMSVGAKYEQIMTWVSVQRIENMTRGNKEKCITNTNESRRAGALSFEVRVGEYLNRGIADAGNEQPIHFGHELAEPNTSFDGEHALKVFRRFAN